MEYNIFIVSLLILFLPLGSFIWAEVAGPLSPLKPATPVPTTVVIIPVLPDEKIGLIRQYRYPMGMEQIELPAGKLDESEPHLVTAGRELEEEIGYRANRLTFLANIHPAIGFANENMWLYLAEDLEKTEPILDNDEFIELIPTKLVDAVEMVWCGDITDVKTIIGLLWAQRLLIKNR